MAAATLTATATASIPTDHDLVAAVRRGDDRAFEELYGRYQRRIAAYIYGMVNDYARAEDITQDVFISALRRMRETERPIAFKPWIYEIAKNACIDQFRRSRRAEEISYDAEEGLGAADYGRLVTTGPSLDAAVDTKQQLSHLCGAFGGLSETHHQILVLRELEGLSYREIGEKMGLSRPSVESTLFRARRRLTEEYDELVSGQRCIRIQTIIEAAAESDLGARDTRRLARHVAHCQPCRRQAIAAGIDTGTIKRRAVHEQIAAKVAGFLPFPAFLRFRRGGNVDAVASSPGQALLAQVPAVSAAAEPVIAGWAKAATAAATLVIASAGAGAVSTTGGPGPIPNGERHTATAVQRSAAAPIVTHERVQPAGPTGMQTEPAATEAPPSGGAGTEPPAGAGTGGGPLGGGSAPPMDEGLPNELTEGPKLPPEFGGSGQQDSESSFTPGDNKDGDGPGGPDPVATVLEQAENAGRSVDGDLGDVVVGVRDILP